MKLTVNGVHQIEGELDELVEFLAKYEERRRGVSISALAGVTTTVLASTTPETPGGHTQEAKTKRKWKSRNRPERHDTKHTEEQRLQRVLKVLRAIQDTTKAYLIGADLGEALGISDLRGLGALRKDMAGFLADAEIPLEEAVRIRGQNPRRYHKGPRLEEAIFALDPQPRGC